MMKQYLFLLWILSISTVSYSQNFIKGIVTDSAQGPIPYCSLALLSAKDSSQVKGNISDSAGYFVFEKIRSGNYFIKFNFIGYKTASTASFSVDSLTQLTLAPQVLKTEGVNLKEISVAVYKPVIEFKKGMVVMNVEDDLLAKGNSVLELLKRIPGVIIDAQNNISINGQSGALFLLDDRLQQMPTPQVIDMLAGMSADAVSKIELIKNPPARYDAAGTGGLINIVTRKAKVKGYNGNIGFGISQGQRMRFGPNGGFNYKSNKLSLFSNASYGVWDGYNIQLLDRSIDANGVRESILSNGIMESFQKVFFGNAGIEYDLTKTTLIGVYVNGNHNNDEYLNNTQTDITNSSAFNYGKMVYTVKDKYNISSPNYNLSILQKIDSIGGQLKLSVGYNNHLETQEKINENHFYDAGGLEVAPASTYKTYLDRNFKVFTQKLDLNKTFKNKFSLEAGLKSSFVDNNSNSKLDYSNRSTGFLVGDTTFYNDYNYKERILAAYSTLSRSWDKIGFSFGLRAEQTDLQAKDLRTSYQFKRSYFNVFPSGSLDLTLNKKNSITAAYSYHIGRPHYSMLNPIRVFNEQLNYSVGNPELKPQFNHNASLDYNYNQLLTVSAGLNYIRDFTFWYTYTPESSKLNVDTLANLRGRNEAYFSVSLQKRIKWYSFQTYGVVMYRSFNGVLKGEDMRSSSYNYYANLNQEFYLPKDFKIQLWAGYGSAVQDGPQVYHARSAIHITVNKAFLDQKLNISLGFYDALFKDYMSYTTKFSNQQFYWLDKMDTRRVRLMINYRFGKMRIQQRLNAEDDSRLKTGK